MAVVDAVEGEGGAVGKEEGVKGGVTVLGGRVGGVRGRGVAWERVGGGNGGGGGQGGGAVRLDFVCERVSWWANEL